MASRIGFLPLWIVCPCDPWEQGGPARAREKVQERARKSKEEQERLRRSEGVKEGKKARR
ncbi:hypothetical protein BC939DRAFT_455751 [Gamsiella multidivaricata]|uniref:uncharacterized protein n=1 Tax=Gamsiella multidivaricata TaxID=101098 RepID=UPI0022206FEC|nr:uncharacterized protein BC939DRAFT_455751 [Gamsiella multidivaricata]KAI7821340.1 hypothetical protein BC939DRAFT_455751 [Gamsiella multidivaricata]